MTGNLAAATAPSADGGGIFAGDATLTVTSAIDGNSVAASLPMWPQSNALRTSWASEPRSSVEVQAVVTAGK